MAGIPLGQVASPPPTVLDLQGGHAPRTLVQVPVTTPQVPVTTPQVPVTALPVHVTTPPDRFAQPPRLGGFPGGGVHVTTPPEGFAQPLRLGGFPGGGAGPTDGSHQQALLPQGRLQQQQQRQQQQPGKPVAAQIAEQAIMDPATREAVRQQAVQLGGHALAAGKYYGHQGLMVFQSYIQQGPRGISILCFVGGAATSVVGLMNVCNLFGSLVDPFHYILSAYMFIFGIVTAVIEADPDSIGTLVPPIDSLAGPVTQAQAWLHDQCKLLTQLRGRGFFYMYQGTLMVTQCVLCLISVRRVPRWLVQRAHGRHLCFDVVWHQA
ncbi:unnamed protein product [Prorocentrum cordatum]|uniref:Vesicle transport protein n=1 Tax=Prorocentrum cordatum TaxID=2364126 RepID=A0ABN9RA81_9DINO|nr:unnamed protein product [Polarella glacialis]